MVSICGFGEPTPAALIGAEVKYVARPKEGDVAYVSGAAGATGLIACHTFKHLGCRVIGSAGSKEKVGIWGGKNMPKSVVTCGSKHVVVTSLKDGNRMKQVNSDVDAEIYL